MDRRASLRFYVVNFLLMALIVGCATAGTPSAPTGMAPTEPPPIISETKPVPEPTVASLATDPVLQEALLSEVGPWWVYTTNEGVWAVNPDGTGITLLLNRMDEHSLTRAFNLVPAPVGGRVAFLEMTDRYTYSPPVLSILTLPDGNLQQIAQLLPDGLDYDTADSEALENAINRWAAVAVWNEMAWSSDGSTLAFNGAQDGPSADLYVYSLQDGTISRLTEGSTQSVKPVWSPDDGTIVHGAVDLLNFEASGNGYNYVSVWAAKADGSGLVRLSANELYGFEEPVGWLSERTMLLDTFDGGASPSCQFRDLRRVNVETGGVDILWEQPYFDRAFDPQSQTALLALRGDIGCDPQPGPGLYFLAIGQDLPGFRIVEDEVDEVSWSQEAGLYFATTANGALAVDTQGQFIDLVVPETVYGLPSVSSVTRQLAWTGRELWVGTLQDNLDQPPRQIHAERVRVAAWSPTSAHLLFFAQDGFYAATAPDFIPLPIFAPTGWRGSWVAP